MKLQAPRRFIISLAVIFILLVGAVSPAFAASQPVIEVTGVVPGGLVTVKISNLPGNTEFTVRMGPSGTQGIAGGLVAHFNTNGGGTQEYTFEVHESVRHTALVDIRIDDGAGTSAWRTFNNAKPFPAVAATSAPATPAATPAPVVATSAQGDLVVLNVQQGGWVKVAMFNLPPGKTFTVRIGAAGTQAANGLGYVVAHFESSSAGQETGTFEIPFNLRAQARLDLRVETAGFARTVSFDNVDR